MRAAEALRTSAGRRGGVTLVEVLVAMVVLGVGLVSVLRALSTCMRVAGIIGGEAIAEEAAVRMLSELRENPQLLLSGDSGDLGERRPGFTWRRELRETGEPGVLAVRITLAWTSQGVPRDYSVVTLVEMPRF